MISIMQIRFDIVTIFPQIFDSYFNESIIKRAQQKKLIKIKTHNLRDFTTDKHKTVDDRPFGGGAGMVLKAEPILKAVQKIRGRNSKTNKNTKIILLSAKGKQFTQKTAHSLAKKYKNIIFISGRYEGVDERVKTALKAEEISIGPYVLTDGDVAAMVIISAITRLIPGVITFESLKEESFWNTIILKEKTARNSHVKAGKYKLKTEYPHYTRPEIITYKNKKFRAPKILLSGNHRKIAEWRLVKSNKNIK